MAFATKYKGEFTDNEGEEWTVEILKDGYGGDVNTMQLTGAPLIIDWPSVSDDCFDQNIRGSSANIGVYCESDFQYSELFISNNLEFKINIYHNTTILYWTGWVDTVGWREDYDGTPYPVSITANDALGSLKEYDFIELSYSGRISISEIIYDIVALIGYTQFTEFVNVYDTLMNSGVGDSPLFQSYVDTDLFKEYSIYDALAEILKPFNAYIIQVGGKIIIARYKELGDTTMYGRIFTSAIDYTATTRTPVQDIDRPTTASDFIDTGGSLMILPALKTIRMNQDYGNKDSWIDTWKFKGEDFDGTDFRDWTALHDSTPRPIGNFVTGEEMGVALTDWDGGGTLPSIYQDFAIYSIISATDLFTVEFEYGYFNTTGSTISNVDILMTIQQGSKELDESTGTTLLWDAVGEIRITANAVVGWSGWSTYRRQFTGLEQDSTIRAILWDTASFGDCYACFRNIKIYASSYETVLTPRVEQMVSTRKYRASTMSRVKTQVNILDIVQKQYTITNDITAQERDYDYVLGDIIPADLNIDNTIEQFKGSLGVLTNDTLVEALAGFVTDNAAAYLSGGVVLTQGTGANNIDLIFTANVAGIDFTGNTTITNTAGTIDGSVVNTTANDPGRVEINKLTMTGNDGVANISIAGDVGANANMTYNTSLAVSIDNFISTNNVAFTANGYALSREGVDILVITGTKAGEDFTSGIFNISGSLDGTVAVYQTSLSPIARVDTITVTGHIGTADILCDAVTKELDNQVVLSPSIAWDTRGGSEDKPLLEIIGDEIGAQFARPKHLLDLELIEQNNAFLDIIGNLQDDLNQYSGSDRVFIINRATYDVKMRKWNLSLNELI